MVRRGVRSATLVFGAGFGAVLIAMAAVAGFVTLALFDERRGLANGMTSSYPSVLNALGVLSVVLAATTMFVSPPSPVTHHRP